MKGILDIESEIYKHDVRNLDIHPRDMMVQNINSRGTCGSNPEIVIVDFGYSKPCKVLRSRGLRDVTTRRYCVGVIS